MLALLRYFAATTARNGFSLCKGLLSVDCFALRNAFRWVSMSGFFICKGPIFS